ncbi:unnamed protein product [Paramecium pentaurelia]|uniref:Uncharacterized protein n=1 Tax=Paramecium pentaurelia TaxID=43138 RepID=A0A8S1S1V1_9CILI|nr:unnamed protein product [Paramecium pentaurelia]
MLQLNILNFAFLNYQYQLSKFIIIVSFSDKYLEFINKFKIVFKQKSKREQNYHKKITVIEFCCSSPLMQLCLKNRLIEKNIKLFLKTTFFKHQQCLLNENSRIRYKLYIPTYFQVCIKIIIQQRLNIIHQCRLLTLYNMLYNLFIILIIILIMQKKTPLNRSVVLEWFEQPQQEFADTLLRNYQFTFSKIPTQEEILSILCSVEKAYNSKRGAWTPCQDKFLNLAVLGICLKYLMKPIELSSQQWEQISRLFRFHNWKACRNRWLEECHKKANWTPQEDKVLTQLQQFKPNKWCEIAIDLMRICKTPYIRQGKQCRDRWVNKLDPNIVNHPWTKEEELQLFREIEQRGKKWAEISLQVFQLRRTENTIKNRYYNLLKQAETKMKFGRITKEQKNKALVDSVIKQLETSVNYQPKQEETEEQENKNYKLDQFDFSNLEDYEEVVILVQKKLVKLNDQV